MNTQINFVGKIWNKLTDENLFQGNKGIVDGKWDGSPSLLKKLKTFASG